jgi:hypothetical protein
MMTIANGKCPRTSQGRTSSRHVRELLHIALGENVRPIARAAKEFGSLERAQNRLAGARVKRPEPLRLHLREMKAGHLEKLPPDNGKQTNEVEMMLRAP